MPPLIEPIPDNLLGRYKVLLQLKDPTGVLVRRFDEMLRTMPGAAHLEATTFSMLQGWFRLQPEIHDIPNVGGPDFKALATPTPLYVECKYLERDSVAERSELPDEMTDEGGSFGLITSKIKNRIADASRQLELRPDGPGIAVIGTDHLMADALMDTLAAEWVLTGTQRIQVAVEGGAAREVTWLQDSVWLAHPPAKGEDFERLRVPVSAVILMTFNLEARTVSMLGVLNPWPRPGMALPIRFFPRLPFARFASPPTVNGATALPPAEWVMCQPDPLVVTVLRPEIPDHMVRGEEPPRRVI